VQALQPGDPIDVVAPSSAFEREKFERGIRALRQIGLVPRFTDGVFTRTGHLAGDDARRKRELEEAFRSDAKALILARGGYGVLRFAADLGSIPRKLLIGYSDTTILHELWRRAGVPSIHGPMCTQLGEDPGELQRLQTLLFGELPPPITWTARTARAGRAEGRSRRQPRHARVHVRTLCSRSSRLSRPLEDLNEPPYRLDRLVTQLLLGGALDGAKAFVIGDLTAPGEDPLAARKSSPSARPPQRPSRLRRSLRPRRPQPAGRLRLRARARRPEGHADPARTPSATPQS